ncbi:MAG: ypdA 1 [Mucilaginibacter sp.]|nr:ypdA 1 [Mucilaginibacter sp.]
MSFIKKYWLEILLHILMWIAVLYVLSALGSSSTFELRVKTINNGVIMRRSAVISLHRSSFFIIGFLMLLFYGNVFWLFKKLVQWKNGYAQIATAAAWFVFIFFADYFIVGLFLDFKSTNAPDFLRLGPKDFVRDSWWHLQLNILLIFVFTLGSSIAYFFSKAWIKNELIRKQLEAHQLSTEIKFLKSQINPHFLFNTLNNLFSMAQGKGNEELADGISRLSAMMRYMIYESNTDRVSLGREIEYLEDCILLNKLRYADGEVKLTFNYPEQTDGLFISPMIFIPFVENAFKHGVSIGQSSQIDIFISVENKQVIFTCENKNYSFIKKMADNNSGIGLENVRRRLELVYGNKYELAIKNEEDKYAVKLKLNLQ